MSKITALKQPDRELQHGTEVPITITIHGVIDLTSILSQLGLQPPQIQSPTDDPRRAFKKTQAAQYLNISPKQLWRRTSQGKIKQTIDGTISKAECDRYLQNSLKP